MKFDCLLAGVGGQGVLSVASIIAKASSDEGLNLRQSEVHGMAQRGGAVLSHLRISKSRIAGDLVPKGSADMIIAMEPLEGLRYLSFLKPSGVLVSASDPFVNIGNYPDTEDLCSTIRKLPSWRLIEAAALAKEAGLSKAVNMVMVGASSCFLPVKPETIEKTIKEVFSKKDDSIISSNIKAFRLGLKMSEKQGALLSAEKRK